ncbi:MAG: hypothetical protein RLY31_356 [Bacteroidota bacterium]|jgi:hypothetical protein
MNVRNCLYLALLSSLTIQACQGDKNKEIPDVSGIPVSVEIRRFEQDFFALDTLDPEPGLSRLEQSYGTFAELFFGQILGSRDSLIAPEGHAAYVAGFLKHPAVRQLHETCQLVFPDLTDITMEFTQAFRLFRHYFPEAPLSGEVVTYLSEYSVGGFLYGDNSIAVGLDFYLGSDYPYRRYDPTNPNFSAYLTRTFDARHLVPKSIGLLVDDLVGPVPGQRLADHMIHNGKHLYIKSLLLPEAPDSIIFEYTQAQVEWCEENEANIWAYLLTEELLYETDWSRFRKLVEPSPTSPGMPAESPGRTANWLGERIVRAYMERHPDLSVQELLLMRDAQALLDQSRYKPKRR